MSNSYHLNECLSINLIFLSPSADSAIVAKGYDGWKGERLGEGV
jgi:hypothetical protein